MSRLSDRELLRIIIATTTSHIDGRDLLDELHPRRSIDIKVRCDGRERWHQGDWLSNLRDAVHLADGRPIDPGSLEYLRTLPQRRLSGSVRTGTDVETFDADWKLMAVQLLVALKGVVAVADRKTDEFDRARSAISAAEAAVIVTHTP